MSIMTDTTQALALSELEKIVLVYYAREVRGMDNTAAPLGGLTVERFKRGRGLLLQRGVLSRDHRGRYSPSDTSPDPWTLT